LCSLGESARNDVGIVILTTSRSCLLRDGMWHGHLVHDSIFTQAILNRELEAPTTLFNHPR